MLLGTNGSFSGAGRGGCLPAIPAGLLERKAKLSDWFSGSHHPLPCPFFSEFSSSASKQNVSSHQLSFHSNSYGSPTPLSAFPICFPTEIPKLCRVSTFCSRLDSNCKKCILYYITKHRISCGLFIKQV